MDPEVIFFDETISASSPKRRDELLGVMRKLADGMTRLVVTHEIRFALEAADRVIFCREARVPCSTSELASSAGSSG